MADWRDMFVGRDDDLQVLQDAWRKAKAGEPQVVAVIAESGLGKTRLIQEFYSWLSTTEDVSGNDGYWPDQLGRVPNASEKRETLLLNPDVDACVMDGRNVPFLWWGIGLPNTGGDSNSVTTSLTQYETRLQLHLLAYVNAVRVSELKMEHAKSAGSTAVSLGLNYAEKILPHLGMAALAGLTFGIAGPAYALMGAIKDVGSAGWEARRRQQEIDRLDSRDIAAATAVAEKHKDIADMILGNLEHVCHAPPKPLAKLPLVLVVDDAQWIRADLSLCKLLYELLARAGEQNWPILVLVTSWEAEWRSVNPITWGGSVKNRISEIFTAQAVKLQEHFLQPAERLEDVVAVAFPGLTESQTALVLSKAEGNALRLYNVLSYLEGKKQFFEGRDIGAPLSAQGAQTFATENFDTFIMQRLQSAPEYVQAALGLASLQGMKFSAQAVAAAASNIEIENADRGLAEGENPHAFIKSAAAELAEFRAEYYQRAADDNLANLMDREDAAKALETALVHLTTNAGGDPEPAKLVDQWQAQLALFASDDVAKRTIAFEALYQLAEKANRDADYLAAQAHAKRWAEEWLQLKGGNSTVEKMFVLGDILRNLGNYELALAFDQITLSQARSNLAAAQQEPDNQWISFLTDSLARGLERVATSLFYLLRYRETLPYYQEAYDIRARQFDADPSDIRLRDLFVSSNQIAAASSFYEGAQANLASVKKSLDFAEQYAERVRDGAAEPHLADALSRYGAALQAASDVEGARPFIERAVAIRRQLLTSPPDRTAMQNLASALAHLASNQSANHEHEAALTSMSEQVSLLEELRDVWSTPQLKLELRAALLAAGDAAKKLGRLDEARLHLEAGFQLSEEFFHENENADNLQYISLFSERIYNIEAISDPSAALPKLEAVLAAKRAIVVERPDFKSLNDLAIILGKLTTVRLDQADPSGAAALTTELPGVVKRLGEMVSDHLQGADYAARLHDLGDVFRLQSRLPEANAIFHQALEKSWLAAEQLKTLEARRTVSLVLERLALVAESQGDLDLALSYLLPCMEIKQELVASTDSVEALNDKVIIANKLVQLFVAKRDYQRACHFAEEGIQVNAVHVERGIMGEEQFAQIQAQIQASTAALLARDDGVDSTITPWQPPQAWFEPVVEPIPSETPRNSPCPCGSGERFKHCHGRG